MAHRKASLALVVAASALLALTGCTSIPASADKVQERVDAFAFPSDWVPIDINSGPAGGYFLLTFLAPPLGEGASEEDFPFDANTLSSEGEAQSTVAQGGERTPLNPFPRPLIMDATAQPVTEWMLADADTICADSDDAQQLCDLHGDEALLVTVEARLHTKSN